LQIIEKMLGIDPKGKLANSRLLKAISPVRVLITFLLVNLAWIFFRMPTISGAFGVIGRMINDRGTLNLTDIYNGSAPVLIIVVGLVLMVLRDLAEEYGLQRFSFLRKPVFQWCWFLMLFVLTLSIGVLDGGQFIYASF